MTTDYRPRTRATKIIEEATLVAATSDNPVFRARMLQLIDKMQAIRDARMGRRAEASEET